MRGPKVLIYPPSLGADGAIYFGSNNDYLYAVNPNGRLRWKNAITTAVLTDLNSSPAIGADGTLYVGSNDRHLYAVDPHGQVKWKARVESEINSPTIGSAGTVYVGTRDGYLYAFRPDGTVQWKSVKIGGELNTSPAIGAATAGSSSATREPMERRPPGPAFSFPVAAWPTRELCPRGPLGARHTNPLDAGEGALRERS